MLKFCKKRALFQGSIKVMQQIVNLWIAGSTPALGAFINKNQKNFEEPVDK